MARKTPGTHSQLIHCSACGEDYASTYKRCPFCGDKHRQSQATAPAAEDDYVFEGGYIFDELDAEKGQTTQQPRGGKRLASGQKPRKRTSIWKRLNISPVRVIGFLFTFLIIIGAFMIVSKVVLPMISRGSVDVPPSEPNTHHSQPVEQDPDESPSTDPVESDPVESDPVETDSPAPTESIPADQTATGLTLNYKEFSISDKYPSPVKITATLSPAGSTATITWTSSNPDVITVDQNGKVTALGKGNATITASIPGGAEATCYVRSTLTGSSSGSSSSGSSSSGSSSSENSPEPTTSVSPSALSLNRDDFTLNDTHPSFTIKASGASGTVSWSSSDSSVATVDQNGKVTKVGDGKCTVTATDESGTSVTCIVRCK